MKRHLLLSGAIGLVLLGSLSFLYIGGEAPRLHEQVLEALHGIEELDAQIERDMLAVHAGLPQQAALGEGIPRLRQVLTRLKAVGPEAFAADWENSALRLKALKAQIDAKEKLIERFRSANGLLRESQTWLDLALAMAMQDPRITPRQTAELASLAGAMLRILHNSDPAAREQAAAALRRLNNLGADEVPTISRVVQHGQVIYALTLEIDRLLEDVRAREASRLAAELLDDYMTARAREASRADSFRLLLFLAALPLLAILLILFTRLQQGAQALRAEVVERRRAQGILVGQKTVLEHIAVGADLDDALVRICEFVDSRLAGGRGGVILQEGGADRPTGQAVASLSPEFLQGVESLLNDPDDPTLKPTRAEQPIYLTDASQEVAASPLRELLAVHGMRALWVQPLQSSGGQSLGILVVAHREARRPADWEREVLAAASTMAAIAVEKHLAERALNEEKERAEVTLQTIADGILTTDRDGRVNYLNPVVKRLTGWSLVEAWGRPLGEVLHLVGEGSGEAFTEEIVRRLASGQFQEMSRQALLVDRNGLDRHVDFTAAALKDGEGRPIGVVVTLHDVSETRRLLHQVSYQAAHDALTGLLNRSEFERQVQDAVAQARSERVEHVLCYLDLDQFKVVNDTCGHAAGDELLKRLTALLQSRVREADQLARLGGDEFGLLLRGCPLQRAIGVAEGLRKAVAEFQFTWEGRTFSVGVSIGVVPITPATTGIAEVLAQADIACYAAKDLGRNRIHVYEPEDQNLARRHSELQWISDINRAMQEDRFQLYAQAIFPVKGPRGQPSHYEILVRLHGEDGKTIPPATFIPAAERYGLMGMVDRWVLRKAFQTCARSQALGNPLARFNINLSGQSLGDDKFVDDVRTLLREYEVPASMLCFEITETAAIASLDVASRFIREIRQMGCTFALDDFGVGLSSFAYLKTLPVDYLKIDGTFVRNMVDDPTDRAMVSAIHEVGRVMGISTIAEFVEDEATLAALREIGVHYVQGYHLAQPVPLEEVMPATPKRPVRIVKH